MSDDVELGAAPSLARLYRDGVTGSLRLAADRRSTIAPDALPSTSMVLAGVRTDADHLTDYQHLLGEPATDALPAGFVHVLAFPVATALMVRPDFPLSLLGMVHVANRVEQRRPVLLGEALDVRVQARDLRSHRSGVTVDLVAEARVGDEVVWQGISTYLAKGQRLEGVGVPDAKDRGEHRAFAAPTPTGLWTLDADTGRRYAAVSGDRNPIHLSSVTARAFGFPRAIAHGMYTAARALADVGPRRGAAFVWEVEFDRPVLLPSRVPVRVAPHDDGAYTFAGWERSGRRRHFAGAVRPLV